MKKKRLEYLKKYLVLFGFGFISLKTKNRIEQKKIKTKILYQTETKLIRK